MVCSHHDALGAKLQPLAQGHGAERGVAPGRLYVVGQPREAAGEGVSDAELQAPPRRLPIELGDRADHELIE
jgi:hypothetical protein